MTTVLLGCLLLRGGCQKQLFILPASKTEMFESTQISATANERCAGHEIHTNLHHTS